MLEPGTTAIILSGTAVGTLFLIVALRASVRAGDWNTTAVFIFALGWLMNIPVLAIVWSGNASFVTGPFGNKILLEPVANPYFTALRWALVAVILLTVTLSFLRGATGGRRRVRHVTIVALLLHIVITFSTGLNNGQMFSATQMSLAVVLAVCIVLPVGRGAHLGAGVFGITLAILSGLAAAVRPAWAVVPCRADKCGPLGFLFRGVLGHENALGITLSVALPYVYLGFRGKARFVLSLYVAGMVVLTGSRTAVIAVAVTLLALAILRPRVDTPADWWRIRVAWVVAVAGLVIGFVLPMMSSDSHGYTGRVYLWAATYKKMDSAPFLGFGRGALSGFSQQHLNPLMYSVHNQFLDMRFAAGWIGFFLFLGILAVMIRNSGRGQRLVMLTVLIAPIYIGITERPWSLAELDGMTFSLLAAMLCAVEASEEKGPPSTVCSTRRGEGAVCTASTGSPSPTRI
ncbi:O-antigen ligase family protein [Streptomyces shenzhenensis]|uniref:O-antigen ligase family protein n=1 Tax=Streptomyces shenzhenensis TaxID=943815 RepID=UPI001F1E6DDC|nr:O-antigen ligase family protein [Streptomyces shenzhenensis]